MKRLFKKIYLWFPDPRFTRPRNLKLFDWMNQNAYDKRVLNLGSGIGVFDKYLSEDINAIDLDMRITANSFSYIGGKR